MWIWANHILAIVNPGKFYKEVEQKQKEWEANLSRKSNILSTVRMSAFTILMVTIIYLVNLRELQWSIVLILLLIILMAILIRIHNRIKYQLLIAENTIDIIQRELKRIKLEFKNAATGEEFISEHHPYSSDLDLFGQKSVFQLLDQTTSFFGRNKLVNWLKDGTAQAEIEKRHQAALELAQNPQWCLEYRSVGLAENMTKDQVDEFNLWMNESPRLLPNKVLLIASLILPLAFVLIAAGAFVFDYTLYTVLPILVISGIVLNKQAGYAKRTVDQTYKVIGTLEVLSAQIKRLEKAEFDASYIKELKEKLQNPYKSSQAIVQLHKLLDRLQARNIMLHILFNLAFLLDIWALRALEKWRLKNANQANQWFESLAMVESLISLSGVYFNFPDWTTPRFSETDYFMKADELAHPMLSEKAVANSFSFWGKGQTFLITGPNMAGKSTFLRTVATNWVLAQTGAPVRASHFVFDPEVRVFTAMRTRDNLNENVSSFYAELDRIKQLIERIKSGEKSLYFLDELLKGTNSADRHKGAESLLKQLHKLKATGFVSTHDLELGTLASKENYVYNYSFESTIKNDLITFDYTIREGISSSFNACALMRKMGIEVA